MNTMVKSAEPKLWNRIIFSLCHFALLVIIIILVILFPPYNAWSTTPRTFYVSSSKGNDTNTGLSPDTPWRTLAPVNSLTFLPGDGVLLKSGDTWRETLDPPGSGTADRPIVISSYGSGPRPRILGSTSKTGPANWRQDSAGVWYTTNISWTPKMIFHSGRGSIPKQRKASLASNWDWWFDRAGQRIYCRLDQNPGNHEIEISRRNGIGFSRVGYIHLSNIEIAFADFGIGLWGGHHWVMDKLYIHDITVDAIHGNGEAKANTVSNSVIQDWGWQGFRAPGGSPESLFGYGIHVLGAVGASTDWTVVNNYLKIVNMRSAVDDTAIAIENGGHASLIAHNKIDGNNATNGAGIMVWRPRGTNPMVIRDNLIKNVGSMGMNLSDFTPFDFSASLLVENNKIINSCTLDQLDVEALRIWTSNSAVVVLKSNLIDTTIKGVNQHPGIRIRQTQRAVLEKNQVYNTDIGISVEQGSLEILLQDNISTRNRVAPFKSDKSSTVKLYGNNFL
jgi:hypothetical protein